MRNIQDVGLEILTGEPSKCYIFAGSEYGIKSSYINRLSERVGPVKEVNTVEEVLSLMSTKHLFPPAPATYVVRYDEEFISKLSDKTSKRIAECNIIGCLVAIYESSKHQSKLEKYLPEWSVCVNTVDARFVQKYLHTDFPELPDQIIDKIVSISSSYGHAKNIATSVSCADVNSIFALSKSEFSELFGVSEDVKDVQIRAGVAARNFKYLIPILECYRGDLDGVLYTILSTLLELEKLITNSYVQSDLRQYVKNWTKADIYNMFMNTYSVLKKLRSINTDTYSNLVYLFSLLQFKEIPAVEVLQ